MSDPVEKSFEKALQVQTDNCRDNLIVIEHFSTKFATQVQAARNLIGSGEAELLLRKASKTLTDILGELLSAQASHGKVRAVKSFLEGWERAEKDMETQ